MRGDLLRKSCHETGSREPINAMYFWPWNYLNSVGAVVVVVVVVGGFAKKETDTNQSLWRHLDYTSPPTPSIHPHSPTCHHQPLPPSSPLLFICFSVFSVVCLPLGWKLCVYAPLCMCVLVCVCVCVCVRERSEMTHWFTVFYIFSSGSLLQCESIDAIILSASLSLFILCPCFSPSLSLSLSLSLFSMTIRVSCCWMEVFTRSVVLPLQETGFGVSAVCFVPVRASVYFCVSHPNSEHGVKYSGVHAPFRAPCGGMW